MLPTINIHYFIIKFQSEREMKEMMKSLGKYARKKMLEVNVEKTKMMVFNKRMSHGRYQIDSEEITYIVGCVWGIEERVWGGDFRRRMMMFESMIERILKYEAEIWG
jgi:hypothetical protein